MNCPNCNWPVADNSTCCFRCGAQFEMPADPNERFYQTQEPIEDIRDDCYHSKENETITEERIYDDINAFAEDYGTRYVQPYEELTEHRTITPSVISLIVNIVLFNLIGVVLSIFSLINHKRYDDELQMKHFIEAEMFKVKAETYSLCTWIILGIGVIAALIYIAIQ